MATGYVSYTTRVYPCRDFYTRTVTYYNSYHYVAYVDDAGRSHPINARVDDPNDCNLSYQNPVTMTTSDGYGYTIYVDDSPSATVYPRSGGVIHPPLSYGAAAGTANDSNGNQITTNGAGVFTDTLGISALTITGAAPSPVSFTYSNPPGVSPSTSSVVMNYTNYTLQTSFGCSGVVEYGPTATSLVSSIALPNGSAYSLTYEATPGNPGSVTGRIASITLPTGGTISYAYTGTNNGIICADGSAAGLARTTADSGTPGVTRSGASPSWLTTIQDPSGNVTKVNFQTVGPSSYETKRQVFQGANTLWRTVNTCYNGSAPDCSTTAITLPVTRRTVYPQLDNGQQLKTDTFYELHGLPTETDEYDFGNPSPGGLLRKTLLTYASLGNDIFDRVASVTVQDGAGTQMAQVSNSYDGAAATPTTGVPQHIAVTGARGNLTSVAPWLNTGTIGATTYVYDDTGNVLSTTDSGGHTTSFAYGNANAFVTQTTMPATNSPNSASHIITATYDINTGLMTDSGDQNNQHTTYTYDNLWRPLTINYPDFGQASLRILPPPKPTFCGRSIFREAGTR